MYPPILLAWIWLLLSTTHAFPLTVNRSPDHSSRPTSAQFDGDPGILFKRGPGDNNAGGSTTSKPSSSSVTSTPPPAGDSAFPSLAWQPSYVYNGNKVQQDWERRLQADAKAEAKKPKPSSGNPPPKEPYRFRPYIYDEKRVQNAWDRQVEADARAEARKSKLSSGAPERFRQYTYNEEQVQIAWDRRVEADARAEARLSSGNPPHSGTPVVQYEICFSISNPKKKEARPPPQTFPQIATTSTGSHSKGLNIAANDIGVSSTSMSYQPPQSRSGIPPSSPNAFGAQPPPKRPRPSIQFLTGSSISPETSKSSGNPVFVPPQNPNVTPRLPRSISAWRRDVGGNFGPRPTQAPNSNSKTNSRSQTGSKSRG